jgi:hypothetical protein
MKNLTRSFQIVPLYFSKSTKAPVNSSVSPKRLDTEKVERELSRLNSLETACQISPNEPIYYLKYVRNNVAIKRSLRGISSRGIPAVIILLDACKQGDWENPIFNTEEAHDLALYAHLAGQLDVESFATVLSYLSIKDQFSHTGKRAYPWTDPVSGEVKLHFLPTISSTIQHHFIFERSGKEMTLEGAAFIDALTKAYPLQNPERVKPFLIKLAEGSRLDQSFFSVSISKNNYEQMHPDIKKWLEFSRDLPTGCIQKMGPLKKKKGDRVLVMPSYYLLNAWIRMIMGPDVSVVQPRPILGTVSISPAYRLLLLKDVHDALESEKKPETKEVISYIQGEIVDLSVPGCLRNSDLDIGRIRIFGDVARHQIRKGSEHQQIQVFVRRVILKECRAHNCPQYAEILERFLARFPFWTSAS